MKRTLILFRHGEAEDTSPSKPADFARNLTAQGIEAVRESVEELRMLVSGLVRIVGSAAARTSQTAAVVAQVLQLPAPELEQRLYKASEEDWMDVVRATEDEVECLILVGHNPVISELAGTLAQAFVSLDTGMCRVYTAEGSWPNLAAPDWVPAEVE